MKQHNYNNNSIYVEWFENQKKKKIKNDFVNSWLVCAWNSPLNNRIFFLSISRTPQIVQFFDICFHFSSLSYCFRQQHHKKMYFSAMALQMWTIKLQILFVCLSTFWEKKLISTCLNETCLHLMIVFSDGHIFRIRDWIIWFALLCWFIVSNENNFRICQNFNAL